MTNTTKPNIYETVTAQIIAAIESGVGTWQRPWHTTGLDAMSPINAISRKPYRGINTLVLWTAASSKGYTSGEWATYKQWTDKGAQVRKGEKATMVVFWKFGDTAKDEQDGEEATEGGRQKLFFTRGYCVFNAQQVDGYEAKPEQPAPYEDRIEAADEFFKLTGSTVRHGGNSAHFSPGSDAITMPPFAAFKTSTDYYSTLAHEHIHWTAIPSRCDRTLGKRFGDNAYAMEELVAEIGAAFLCAKLRIEGEPREDHAQYVANWLKVLKADNRAIFTAAGKAQNAADFLIAKSDGEVDELESEAA